MEREMRLKSDLKVKELLGQHQELIAYQNTVQSYFQIHNSSTKCTTAQPRTQDSKISAPLFIPPPNGEPIPAFMKAIQSYQSDLFDSNRLDSNRSIGEEAQAILNKKPKLKIVRGKSTACLNNAQATSSFLDQQLNIIDQFIGNEENYGQQKQDLSFGKKQVLQESKSQADGLSLTYKQYKRSEGNLMRPNTSQTKHYGDEEKQLASYAEQRSQHERILMSAGAFRPGQTQSSLSGQSRKVMVTSIGTDEC